MRINKFLADSGVSSRRNADKIIEEGRVTVNGKRAAIGQEVDPYIDEVVFDGKKISVSRTKLYFIMNKPKGYVTTVKDDKGRKTVMDLLPPTDERGYPVGRLDYDTEGLLILTNDGELANRLMHPTNEIPKTYHAKVEGEVSELALSKLRSGVYIDGVKTGRANVKIVDKTKEFTKLSIVITEGRNRQIRKMLAAVGKEVVFLKRVKIGDLTLKGLDRGQVRKLTKEEVYYLQNL